MFEHHQKTIQQLRAHFYPQADISALIIVGSVARDDAGASSDVDFFVVSREEIFNEITQQNAGLIKMDELCISPCTEANGSVTTKDRLLTIRDSGCEIERWAYTQAILSFTKDPEIESIVTAIPMYPEEGRIYRMESYFSQMFYHFSFFEFAYYSQTKYLIYETAVKLILSAGRLILADNYQLYPNRKWFFRELAKVEHKPDGVCDRMEAFLDEPTIDAGKKILDAMQAYKKYPVPPEGIPARIAKESILNLEAW